MDVKFVKYTWIFHIFAAVLFLSKSIFYFLSFTVYIHLQEIINLFTSSVCKHLDKQNVKIFFVLAAQLLKRLVAAFSWNQRIFMWSQLLRIFYRQIRIIIFFLVSLFYLSMYVTENKSGYFAEIADCVSN